MVVCKCRKATRIYCFVHKVPVCGECICFPEHQICVVRKYSDWVVNGEYDWPPTCSLCHAALEAGTDSQTTRLGCLHLMHKNCLVSHIRSFPSQQAPSEYVCPTCTSPIWPPKDIKGTGSLLHSKIKKIISENGLENTSFGNYIVSLSTMESRNTPPAFASDPVANVAAVVDRDNGPHLLVSTEDSSIPSSSADPEKYSNKASSSAIGKAPSKLSESINIEIDGSSSSGNPYAPDQDPNFMKSTSPVGAGATTRKVAYHVERENSETSYYADDEDGTYKKYTRRGPLHHKFLRLLLPFWSKSLPTLPVTAPQRKDGANTADVSEGRLRPQRSSRMDPRKILLIMALMACMATMGILYYRLAQRSLGENMPEDELQ